MSRFIMRVQGGGRGGTSIFLSMASAASSRRQRRPQWHQNLRAHKLHTSSMSTRTPHKHAGKAKGKDSGGAGQGGASVPAANYNLELEEVEN